MPPTALGLPSRTTSGFHLNVLPCSRECRNCNNCRRDRPDISVQPGTRRLVFLVLPTLACIPPPLQRVCPILTAQPLGCFDTVPIPAGKPARQKIRQPVSRKSNGLAGIAPPPPGVGPCPSARAPDCCGFPPHPDRTLLR